MYKVIKAFFDLKDSNHFYNVGDVYPRKDVDLIEERAIELCGNTNRQGVALLKKITPKKKSIKE